MGHGLHALMIYHQRMYKDVAAADGIGRRPAVQCAGEGGFGTESAGAGLRTGKWDRFPR